MSKTSTSRIQTLQLLSSAEIEDIHNSSLIILHERDIMIKNDHALALLKKFGCESVSGNIVHIPEQLVKECIKKAPSTIRLYGRNAKHNILIGEENTIFNPGSTAIYFVDHQSGQIRKPLSKDLVDLVRLVDFFEYIGAQSTAVVPSDVPQEIQDLYRLYLVLKNSTKAIITGAFTKQGLIDMKQMLEIIAGGETELARKPMAIFDVCPSSPLMWSDVSCQNLLDCAKFNIPAEIIPAPQMGATSPITLAGTLVQSNAEFLAGLVISQIANPGASVIYGCSQATFDMRFCAPCLGAIETIMLACASSQMGKFYGIPTHAYLGVSDSKTMDAQCGLESSIGLITGTLAGINVISGPGMLAFENCQSLEKLVVDNEICGMSLKLVKDINVNEEKLATKVISKVGPGGHYLAEEHTRKWLRNERFIPSNVIDRLTLERWMKEGKSIIERAREIVDAILREHTPEPLPTNIESELMDLLKNVLRRYHIDSVPIL